MSDQFPGLSKGHLDDLYSMQVSLNLISTITDAVLEHMQLRQSRSLETVYSILHFDCLFLKSWHEDALKSKDVYVVFVVNL